MPTDGEIPLLQIIRDAVFPLGDDRASDRELLNRFALKRDEGAFAALVRRHSAMVMGVGARVLRNHQDAEDNCQATFLILAKKASSMSWRDSVVNWLYGVAYRLALESRGERQQRMNREMKVAAKAQVDSLSEITLRDFQAILDSELSRLPKKYCEILLLCCLQGQSRDEAARSLGLSPATVKSRLEKGRAMLGRRLARRGIEFTTVLASATLQSSSVSAAVARATSSAAIKVLTGESIAEHVSAGVVTLMTNGLQTMLLAKLKVATVMLLVLGIVGTGIVSFLHDAKAPAQDGAAKKSPIAKSIAKARSDTDQPPVANGNRKDNSAEAIEFSGRVVGPNGRSVAGASLYVVPDIRSAPGTWNEVLEDKSQLSNSPVYAISDINGDFRFQVPKSIIGDWPADLTASAPQLGAGWVTIPKGGATNQLMIPLVTDDVPITGQIVDAKGLPVVGAKLSVLRIRAADKEDLEPWLADIQNANLNSRQPRLELEKKHLSRSTAALPLSTRTDAEGRFRLNGIGSNRVVLARLDGSNIASQQISFRSQIGKTIRAIELVQEKLTDPTWMCAYYGADFRHEAAAARSLSGLVRDIDTKKPLAGIIVRNYAEFVGQGDGTIRTAVVQSITDAEGRYQLDGLEPREYVIMTDPGPQPYIIVQALFYGNNLEPAKTIEMKRGVWIEGKITDKVTGQPVQATVEYYGMSDNPNNPRVHKWDNGLMNDRRIAKTKPDGTYRVPGFPGAGLVAVHEKFNYLHATERDDEFAVKEPAPETAAHAIDAYNKPIAIALVNAPIGAETVKRDLTIDPGWKFTISVLGTDGKLLAGVRSFSLAAPEWVSEEEHRTEFIAWQNPSRTRHILFQHLGLGLVGVAKPAIENGGYVAVRMTHAAAVAGRLVDANGRPRGDVELKSFFRSLGQKDWSGFSPAMNRTDRDGRFRVTALPPDYSFRLTEGNKELRFGPNLPIGKTTDLGDIRSESVTD